MSWESLKAVVASVVTTNGNNEITGEDVRTLLNNNVIPQLGASQYKGIAVPATNPGVVEKEIWYFARTNGTYSNFGGLKITDECAIFRWNGTNWVKDIIFSYASISIAPVTVEMTTAPYTYNVPEGSLVDQIAISSPTNQNIIVEIETGTGDIYDGTLDEAEILVLVVNKQKKSGLLPIHFNSFTNPIQVKFYLR